MLLTVFCVVREMLWIRRLIFAWAAVGAVDASVALVQYAQKMREARALGLSFYQYYVEKRITGAMSHWMTFGGTEMFVLLMLAAYLLFSGGQVEETRVPRAAGMRGRDCRGTDSGRDAKHLAGHRYRRRLSGLVLEAAPVVCASGGGGVGAGGRAELGARALHVVLPAAAGSRFQPAPHRDLAHRRADDSRAPMAWLGA